MKYFIGMDGGGTKTKCIVTDVDFNVLFECAGGPSSFLIHGTEKVSDTILTLLGECKDALSLNYSDFSSVVLGTTGAGRKSDANKLTNDLIKIASAKGIELPLFDVVSDARIALEGAFGGGPGSILIAGTGSIMFGKDDDGVIHRVGGFGRFIGDEGSGYMLGRKGLIAVAKQMDGRGLKTDLTDLIGSKFSIGDSSSLITEIYSKKFDIASVAPLVIKAGENGDEICNNIIEEEIEELILHIRSMKEKFKTEWMKLCLIGGTIATDNYYSKLFKKRVGLVLRKIIITKPKYPPAVGAAVMAKDLSTP